MIISVEQAITYLLENKTVALPTETVYGLAGNAFSAEAVNAIYDLKKRPTTNPLIFHLSEHDDYKKYTTLKSELVEKLIKAFWPGPLTLILPQKNIPEAARAGLETVALRSPRHPLFQEILSACDFPLVAPSANPYSQTSPTSAKQVEDYFPKLPVVEGGECEVGLESTTLLIQADQLQILRPGYITKTTIEKSLQGFKFSWLGKDLSHLSPGTDKQHYQPGLPVILAIKEDITIAMLDKKFKNVLQLDLPLDPITASSTLYKQLWLAGKNPAYNYIFINAYGRNDEQWLPILDRLKRAASVFL